MRRRNTILSIIAIIIATFFIVATILILMNRQGRHVKTVDSFDECVAAGNPILQSYPEICVAAGKSYTNPHQTIPGSQVPSEKP